MDLDKLLNGGDDDFGDSYDDKTREEMSKFVEEQTNMLMEASVTVIETQIKAGYFKVIAKANMAYFESLVEAGFSEKEAINIVINSAHTLMSHKG